MNDYLDINALSHYLHIKASTLYAWVAQGKIPCVKIHGLIRFRRDEIDQWVEAFHKQSSKRRVTPAERSKAPNLDGLIASAKREVYTRRRGETRTRSSLIRKEELDGAV